MLVKTDDKVTQAYINHVGGRSPFLNSIAHDLWSMCYQAQILLVSVHRLINIFIGLGLQLTQAK